MLDIKCAWCKDALTQPGAIVIAPPHASYTEHDGFFVMSYHACVKCFNLLSWNRLDNDEIKAIEAVRNSPDSSNRHLLAIIDKYLL